LEFNVPFQHKYGYIRDEGSRVLPVHLCGFRHISTSGLGVGASLASFITIFGRR